MDYNDYEADPPPESPKDSEKDEDVTKAAEKLLRYVSSKYKRKNKKIDSGGGGTRYHELEK